MLQLPVPEKAPVAHARADWNAAPPDASSHETLDVPRYLWGAFHGVLGFAGQDANTEDLGFGTWLGKRGGQNQAVGASRGVRHDEDFGEGICR